MHWTTQLLAGATSIWIGLLLCGKATHAMTETDLTVPPIYPPNIEAIREISQLVALEVEATEIVTTEIKGYTGSTSVVVLVQGTLTYGVDLDLARFLQTEPKKRHLVLSLPEPSAHQVAIDPHASRLLSCERSGLWQIAIGPAREDEALMSAISIGHGRLFDAASQNDLVSQARRHAEAVLVRFVSEMDWTLEVRWDE